MSIAQRRRLANLAVVVAAAVLLPACAPEPVTGWSPTGFSPVPGIVLASAQGVGSSSSEPAAASDAPGASEGEDPAAEGGTAAEGGAAAQGDAAKDDTTEGATATLAPRPDQKQLGVYTGRLRNDATGVSARFVYLPGVPAFNDRMNQEIRAAISATGKPYSPQSYAPEQGRTERGCVPGSSTWSAIDVLQRVETGPVNGAGAAVVCDLVGAYGNLVEVRLRTVAGDAAAGAVTVDTLAVLFVDVASGEMIQVADEWNSSAAPELWRAVVELLRRDAGALSTAPVADPDEQQLALVSTALHTAEDTAEGGLVVTVPAGIAAPELAGLGIEVTTEPLELHVDQATASAWSNEQYRELHAQLGKPFVGFAAGIGAVHIDCKLIPCVAVTYDDGPSELTPQLLNTLAAEGARATFFMLSSHATSQPDVVAQALAAGNEIATHTINHPDLTMIPLPEAKAQVLNSAAVISGITGKPVTMFRPPYGEVNDPIIAAVGMPAILWSIDTNDWRLPGQQALIERSAGAARPGDIILFHDTHSDTVEAAGAVVRGLHDRGLELVTVTQLFGGHVPGGRVSSR